MHIDIFFNLDNFLNMSNLYTLMYEKDRLLRIKK